jgi:hypothetical protein
LYLLLLLLVLRRHSDPALAEVEEPHTFRLAVVCSASRNQRTVISTEAAHSLIMSSTAEKSASLTIPSLSQDRALAVEFVVVFSSRHSAEAEKSQNFAGSFSGWCPNLDLSLNTNRNCRSSVSE